MLTVVKLHIKTALYAVLLLPLLVTSVILVAPTQTTYAIDTATAQKCFDRFDDEQIIYSSLSIADQTLYNQCRSEGACRVVREGTIIGSNLIDCTDPSAVSSTTVTQASTAETAPLVTLICGSAPSGESAQSAYVSCADKVRKVYATCSTSGGPVTSATQMSAADTAECMKKTYSGETLNNLTNAIKDGRTASSSVYQTAFDANTKAACIADNDKDGNPDGVWKVTDGKGSCEANAANTVDDCPLPDDTSMRWLGCSIMSVAKVATTKLYGAIQNFLFTPTAMIFDNPQLKKASTGIRNLAIGLILIAGLIMVIAQASGSDLVDAYTIRKLLPRLGVAIIGIALAWPILEYLITFVNFLGLLADRLLLGVTQLGVNGGGSANEVGTNILSTIFALGAGGGAVLFLGAMGVISLAGTIMLALLVGLLVLAVRQLVIMVCVLLAPLAIAAYVLPGTQKLWSFWKTTLLTSLMMFPIIMFFLASGTAFSAILGGANSTTTSLLAIIVFIAPYFLLPFAFKLAGGLMATIFSIANDKNRGMFDRLRKGRQKAVHENFEGMKEGNRFKGNNAASRWANKKLEYTTNANKAGLNPYQMRSRMRTALASNAHDEASKLMKEDEDFTAISGDDAKLYAGKATNRSDIERRLAEFDEGRFGGQDKMSIQARTDATNQILRAQRKASGETFQIARTRAMASTGTGYQYENENGDTVVDYSTMLEDINDAYGSDRNGAGRALAEMRNSLANSGHVAGLAGFGTWAGALDNTYKKQQAGTYTKAVDGKAAHKAIMADTMLSVPAGNALYGKPSSAAALGAAHKERLDLLVDSKVNNKVMDFGGVKRAATDKDIDTALAAGYGILQTMSNQAPQNAAAFSAEFMGQPVANSGKLAATETVTRETGLLDKNGKPITTTVSAGGPTQDFTVRDLVDNRSGSKDFNALVYNYSYSTAEQGKAYQQQMLLQQQLAQQGGKPGGGLPPANIGQPPRMGPPS